MRYLRSEIKAYHRLRGSGLVPVLAYIYEETPDRIIGIAVAPAHGDTDTASSTSSEGDGGTRARPAELRDLEPCQQALGRLYAAGVVHNDLCRYNILIVGGNTTSAATVQFVDLEDVDDRQTWNHLVASEQQRLAAQLADPDTKRGRSWDMQ